MIIGGKKIGVILGGIAFFSILVVHLEAGLPQEPSYIVMVILKSVMFGAVFWFMGLIVGDILVKGIIEDIEFEQRSFLEGGILQRIQDCKKHSFPGEEGMPFIGVDKREKKKKDKDKK